MERGMSYYNRDQFGRPTIFVPQYLKTLDQKDLSELAQSVNAEQRRRARERVKKETDRLRAESEARRKAQRLQQPQTSSFQSLHILIFGNSPALRVEKELAAGADINATDCERRTVLWRAAEHSKNELIALLLARGADVNKDVTKRQSPLHKAVSVGNTEGVRLLIDAGADVAAGKPAPLVVACKNGWDDVVRELIRGGAKDSGDALDKAVKADDLEMVKLLCDSGASSAKDADLLHAVRERYYDVCEALLSRGADAYEKCERDVTAMMYALDRYCERMWGQPPRDDLQLPDRRLAKLLVAHGCDVNRLQGGDALYDDETHSTGSSLVAWAANIDCSREQTAIVDLLCGELGADPNLRHNQKPSYPAEDDPHYRMFSPLDVACEKGHFALVERLVDRYDARVHTTRAGCWHEVSCTFRRKEWRVCIDLMTPVRWLFYENMAAHYQGGLAKVPERMVIFRFLVSHGAQVSHRDALEYQKVQVDYHMDDLEKISVSQVRALQPIIDFGAEILAVAQQQEAARRAAATRAVLLLRSAGRATIVEDCEDERARCGVSLIARVSVRGAFGQGFARRALDLAFGGAAARALERRHREAYETAVGDR